MDAGYNDVQEWKYKDVIALFGADPKKSKTFQVKTKQEAHDLFNDEEFSSAPYIQVMTFISARSRWLTGTSLSNYTCQEKMLLKRSN